MLVIAGKSRDAIEEEEKKAWEEVPLEEHMARYETRGMERKAAMKAVAKDRGIRKSEVYQGLLEGKQDC